MPLPPFFFGLSMGTGAGAKTGPRFSVGTLVGIQMAAASVGAGGDRDTAGSVAAGPGRSSPALVGAATGRVSGSVGGAAGRSSASNVGEP